MNAAEILNIAATAHVRVRLRGNSLVLDAPTPPPSSLLAAVASHKAELMDFLRGRGWSPADWAAFFQERAAIREYDGQLARDDAEAQAVADCVMEWMRRNPVVPAQGGCAACGGGGDHEVLVPYGLGRRIALHARCWESWYEARRAAAQAALMAMAVPPT